MSGFKLFIEEECLLASEDSAMKDSKPVSFEFKDPCSDPFKRACCVFVYDIVVSKREAEERWRGCSGV